MWCRKCNMETNGQFCPVCGTETVEDLPTEIFWCKTCQVPIIHNTNAADRGICPICGSKTRYMAQDLRPVFPEERLLLAILEDKDPAYYMDKPIWSANSRYYTGDKSFQISTTFFQTANTDTISKKVKENAGATSYTAFDKEIAKFITANQHRLSYLKDEAFAFVKDAAAKFKEENIVISFSGGKDSTVTADVVTKALSNPSERQRYVVNSGASTGCGDRSNCNCCKARV